MGNAPANGQFWAYASAIIGIAGLIIALFAWRWPVAPVSEKRNSVPYTNFIAFSPPPKNPAKTSEEPRVRPEETNREESSLPAKFSKTELPQQIESKEQKPTLEKATIDLKAYRERYLTPVEQNRGISKARLAVAAASQDKFDTALADSVSLMASRSGFYPVNRLIKSEFVSDGLFAKAFDGEFHCRPITIDAAAFLSGLS